jgi:simple sugar transport system permease protein
MSWLAPLVASVLTLVAAGTLFWILGHRPLHALGTFVVQPLRSANSLAELLLKASPLMLIATGLASGFRANVWNIGAEGQLTLGAICATAIALRFGDTDSRLVLPAVIVAGALGGMLWAAVPALLRTRFRANEILVSLMLVYVAALLLSWLVHGPWRDPEGFNFPQTRQFGASAIYPIVLEGTRLNASILVSLAAVVAGALFVDRSFLGFQMRVTGLADAAGRYAGFDARRMVWLGMLLGGAAAGVAGAGEVAGPIGQLLPSVSPGYGFAAIIVAFVGGLHPLGILFASLLMSLMYLGGEAAQMELGLPSAITGLFQGLLLFFLLATSVLTRYRVRLVLSSRDALSGALGGQR